MQKKKMKDFAVTAHDVMAHVIKITETPKNPHAVALGRIGGSKGGTIRAAKLSPARRSEIAKKAAKARWAKKV
jgi:hypothetical protein